MSLRVDIGVGRVFLNEFAARFYVVTHQHGENFISLCSILDGDLLKQTVLRIHGRLPKLFGVHLTKTFVALRVQSFVFTVTSYIFINKCLTLLFCIAVF